MTQLTVLILLSESFSNIVLACLLEPLRVVRDNRGADIRWTILTASDAPVTSSSGIRVAPDRSLQGMSAADLTLIVGGDEFRAEAVQKPLSRHLNPLLRSGVVIGADTGSWLMAALGLLDGRRATIHWQLHDEFAESFLATVVEPDRFVQDGRFWTCGSAATALDLILEFITSRYGAVAAQEAAAMFLQDSASAQLSGSGARGLRIHGSEQLRMLITRMADTLETPLSLAELAAFANMSERSLARLFKQELGVSPGRHYQALRLARARDLSTHTRLSVEEIALRCGFSSASGLRRAFRKQYGQPVRRRTRRQGDQSNPS
ncbi:GlxA family transcriptional regulator [Ruegeria arenilitoris]|uniref:GlxA family transcriptional regulator n=1 Tax=Ruegeria arenilitoris TaxID=1173585 RepID=UPI0014812553